MVNVVQWSIDRFRGELQRLSDLSRRLKADLEADKAELTALYSATRRDPDPARRALNQQLLQPQIHNNSKLRMQYAGIVAKFNQAVAAAGSVLKRAGYTAPGLSGLGAAPLLIGGAAIALVTTAFLIYQSVRLATDAQRTATRALAERVRAGTATEADLEALRKTAGMPPGKVFDLDLGQLAPILGMVALIMFGPQLLQMFRARRAA